MPDPTSVSAAQQSNSAIDCTPVDSVGGSVAVPTVGCNGGARRIGREATHLGPTALGGGAGRDGFSMSDRLPAAARALEMRYTLKEASEHFFQGRVTDKTLRSEFGRHRIPLECIGGKFFCTASDISALSTASKRVPGAERDTRPCPVTESPPASTSGEPEATVEPPGSFSTERRKLARAQVLATVKRLRQPSKTISPATTSPRVVPIDQTNSSSRKS
jgi:hypothetical protein